MEHSNSSEYNYQDQKIIEKQIEGEIKTSFISYAVSVLTARALPDVRDGLKPGAPAYFVRHVRGPFDL